MVRLLAWGLNAAPDLEFTKGLCADDEPDLWRKELHGDIAHWIEVGLPDERRLKRACNRSAAVTLYAYGARAARPGGNKTNLNWPNSRTCRSTLSMMSCPRRWPPGPSAL